MTTAITISGGEIKAAVLGGMVATLLENGVEPDEVLGTSAGALNTFLIAGLSAQGLTWKQVGSELRHIYVTKINEPKQFVKKRGFLDIAKQALVSESGLGRWTGLYDMSPLHQFVHSLFPTTLDFSLAKCPCTVVMYDIANGSPLYVSNKSISFIDATLASTAVPIVMESNKINETVYVDGGLSDFVPIPRQDTAKVYACLSQPDWAPGKVGKDFNPYKLSHIIKRTLNVVTTNALLFNLEVLRASTKKLVTISPSQVLPYSITTFTKQDILDMVNLGTDLAKKALVQE